MKIEEWKNMNIVKKIPGWEMKKIDYQGKGSRKLKRMKGMEKVNIFQKRKNL